MKTEQLNETQLEILAEAGKGRGFVVTGPPGSGKTNLLMIACHTMKTRGYENTKVIVFTSALKDFIASGLSLYKLEDGSVETLSKLAWAIARDHGDRLPENVGFAESQKAWRTLFEKYVESGKAPNQSYDALLIDESQDFNSVEVSMLLRSARYVAFSIDTNQSIYERTEGKHPVFGMAEEDGLEFHVLTVHYRAGRRICRFADLVMEGRAGYQKIEDNSNYKETERPSSVEFKSFPAEAEEYESIIGKVANQLSVYPGERIGILFPTNLKIRGFKEYCENHHRDFLGNQLIDPIGSRAQLFVGTMHESKGLEFAVVHIGGQDKLSAMSTQRTLLFTSVTRARYACYLSSTGKVPGYLTSAYARLDGPIAADPFSAFEGL